MPFLNILITDFDTFWIEITSLILIYLIYFYYDLI